MTDPTTPEVPADTSPTSDDETRDDYVDEGKKGEKPEEEG